MNTKFNKTLYHIFGGETYGQADKGCTLLLC